MGESINSAAKRIVKDKFNIEIIPKEVKSISLEHVKRANKIIHSFILILVSAKTKDKIKLIEIKRNKNKIIASDYKIITKKPEKININTFYTPAY